MAAMALPLLPPAVAIAIFYSPTGNGHRAAARALGGGNGGHVNGVTAEQQAHRWLVLFCESQDLLADPCPFHRLAQGRCDRGLSPRDRVLWSIRDLVERCCPPLVAPVLEAAARVRVRTLAAEPGGIVCTESRRFSWRRHDSTPHPHW
jgi:hypothetical protein